MSHRTWPWRLALTIIVCVAAAYMIFPTLVYFALEPEARSEAQRDTASFKARLPVWSHEQHTVPGLDLQGGAHLVFAVDLKRAVRERTERIAGRIRSELRHDANVAARVEHLEDEGVGDRIRVELASREALAGFAEEQLDDHPDLVEVTRSDRAIVLRIHPDVVKQTERDTVERTIRVFATRIGEMHVTDASITKRGADQVQVQLPGYADPEEAKTLIGRTGQDELRLIDDVGADAWSSTMQRPSVTLREERSIGPSLGEDALSQAAKGCLVGAVFVSLFMVLVYKIGGVIAMMCAIFNVLLVVSTISFFSGTVSLPGLAALLLTVGIALDGSVLINERIRDELRTGKRARAAVDAGYGSAVTAIFDGNVTVAVAGLVCLVLGSGGVQSFAATLLIGIVSTMFTAVFVSRVCFDAITSKPRDTLWL